MEDFLCIIITSLASLFRRPVPKVKKPKLTMKELELFPEYAD